MQPRASGFVSQGGVTGGGSLMDMRVSSDPILLALPSTWKRNEEIKSFMIMHVAWGKEELGVSRPKPGSQEVP